MPQPGGSDGRQGRLLWMDSLRGLAILLMLFWHATSLPVLAGLDVPPGLLVVNDLFLPFRMPALMFLSGLLLPRALSKPWPVYVRGKVSLVLWPWLVWMVAYRIADGSTWALVHPTTYVGRGYLWFLFFLCLYYAVAPLLAGLPAWVAPALFMAAAVGLQPTSSLWHRVAYFGVFFFAGAWVARSLPGLLAARPPRWLVAALAVPPLALAVASARSDVAYVAWLAPVSLLGIVVAIDGARRLPDRLTRGLRYVGRNSLVYYVSHFPVMVATLWLLRRVGGPAVLVVVGLMVVALAVGTLAARLRGRPAVRWLFELPVVEIAEAGRRILRRGQGPAARAAEG